MTAPRTPLQILRQNYAEHRRTPAEVASSSLAHANGNASQNTYLHLDPDALHHQAAALSSLSNAPLFGVPVSLKDCFDLAGTVTTAGSRFYAQRNGPAHEDSAVAARLRALGCLITGKTHLHPLAYGITGENPDFGDCLQPRDPGLLTGGSSSGAAASVQEGSALFAIGTDTGGSIRVPAALCGLAGFRASHSMTAHWPEMWSGGVHLAASFDTLGFLAKDPRDLEAIALALFDLQPTTATERPRLGCMPASLLENADRAALEAHTLWQDTLGEVGCSLSTLAPEPFRGALDIFAPIQASEAAAIHRGFFDHFEPGIAQRLAWGASLTPEEVAAKRREHEAFRSTWNALFDHYDFIIMPATPCSELRAATDLSQARPTILGYTTQASLGVNPVVSLPTEWLGGPRGTGLQIVAAPGRDAALLAFTSALTQRLGTRHADADGRTRP